MSRMMLWKEFRELSIWIGVILVILVLATINLAGTNPFTLERLQWNVPIPFANQNATLPLMIYGAIAASLIALRQTVGESFQGTWLLLLHRPVTRRWIIRTKLAAGLCALLFVIGIPFTGYLLWAATPGTHASPFRWPLVIPTLVVALSTSTVYLGAFLAGLRETRWFGTRLLPLFGAMIIFFMLDGMTSSMNHWVCWIGLAMTLFVNGLLLLAIDEVTATREFST